MTRIAPGDLFRPRNELCWSIQWTKVTYFLLNILFRIRSIVSSHHNISPSTLVPSMHHSLLWEAAVKSMKFHLRQVVGAQRLTYEKLHTILCQVECCLNSRPLLPLDSHSEDGIDTPTPAHFLIGRPMQSLPNRDLSTDNFKLLRRWSLCQAPAPTLLEALVPGIPAIIAEVHSLENTNYEYPTERHGCHPRRHQGLLHSLAIRKSRQDVPRKGWTHPSSHHPYTDWHLQAINCEACSPTPSGFCLKDDSPFGGRHVQAHQTYSQLHLSYHSLHYYAHLRQYYAYLRPVICITMQSDHSELLLVTTLTIYSQP